MGGYLSRSLLVYCLTFLSTFITGIMAWITANSFKTWLHVALLCLNVNLVYIVYVCLHYEFVALPNVSVTGKKGQGDALNGNILWLSCENCLQQFYLAMSGMCQRTLWKVIQGLKDSRNICKSQLMQDFKQTINTDYGKISNVLDSSRRVCIIHCNAVMQKQLGLFNSVWSCRICLSFST